jgi:hypothetical protein
VKPDPAAPLVFLDTSAVVELAVTTLRGGNSFPHRFRTAIDERWGHGVQLAVHPVSLAELATNSHEEVHHSRARSPRPAADHSLTARANACALVALRSFLGGGSDELALHARPIVPTWADWMHVVAQRNDHRLLRCTRDGAVKPVADMVDHVILGLASSYAQRGYTTGFVSGDAMQLGAAARLGIGCLDVKDLRRVSPHPWKSCASDGTCVAGCSDGVADCVGMFN